MLPELLKALYPSWPEGQWFEIRHIGFPDRSRVRTEFYEKPFVPRQLPGHHLFFGVNPRSSRIGKDDSINLCHALYVDMDSENDSSALAIQTFQPRISAIVASGRGKHLYWFIDPVLSTSYPIKQILRGLAKELGGDPQCITLQQLLRLPGSVNPKNGKTAREIFVDAHRRYEIEEFLPFARGPEPTAPGSHRLQLPDLTPNLPERFLHQLRFDRKIKEIWKDSLVYASGSHQDFALTLLLTWQNYTSQQIAEVLLAAPWPKRVPRSRHYLQATISAATAAVERARCRGVA